MSKIVAVPDELYNKAAEVAAKDQVSVEEFVSAAVADRLACRLEVGLRFVRIGRCRRRSSGRTRARRGSNGRSRTSRE